MRSLPGSSFLQALRGGLFLALVALGQLGGDGLRGMAHRLACDCCESGSARDGCCSERAQDERGPVWTKGTGSCACSALPSDSSPAPVSVALPSESLRDHLACQRVLGSVALVQLVWSSPPENALAPPGWSAGRAGSFAGRAGSFLGRSGGERAAWLGCARS